MSEQPRERSITQPPSDPSDTITGERGGPRPEVRLALALNGGVSLAVWIGGVVNEVLRICRGSDPAYRELTDTLGVDVRADVMTGASAGGLNAVFLALGLIYGHDDLAQLRDTWVRVGDFEELLRDPLSSEAPSLMRGDDYFLPEVRRAIGRLMTSGSPPYRGDVDVRLTVTSLTGDEQVRPDDFDGVLRERRHDAILKFEHRLGDFDDEPANVDRLARACRSTASFPGAFEPSFASVEDPGAPIEGSGTPPRAEAAFVIGQHIEGVQESRFLIDGGVLVNLPVKPAIDAVFGKPATGEVRRILAMVVPDPAAKEDGTEDEPGSAPGLLSVVGASASGLPRTQSVRQFLDDTRSHNDEVRMLRRQREALLTTMIGGVPELVRVSRSLFDAYRAGRRAANKAQAAEELIDLTSTNRLREEQIRAWRIAIDRVFDDPGFDPPWIPTNMISTERWGTSPLERTVGRLLQLLNRLLERGPSEMESVPSAEALDLKRAIHDVRARVLEMAGGGGASILGTDTPPEWTSDQCADRIRARANAWPGTPEGRATIEAAMEDLARLAERLGRLPEASSGSKPFIAALPGQGQGLAFIASLEVLECAFGDFDDIVDQLVEIAQVDALSPAPVDPHRRDGGKVAGIQLGHFGAFLKRSWRANDWMWGRLDGATHLCRLLMDRDKPQVHQEMAERVGLPISASPSEIAEAWASRVQLNILRAELPSVAEAIRSDLEVGSARGTFSAEFLGAYEAKMRSTGGNLTDSDLRSLLAVERIGEERLSDELGSDLVTRVSVHALATGATVVHRGSPTVLRSAVAAIRYVAILAWAFTRTAGSRNGLINAFGAMLFGAGLIGVVLDLFYGFDLGVFALPAWVAFGAGLLLAFARAPYVVVPMLVLALVPRLLAFLPEEPWSWYPMDLPWPRISSTWEWVTVAGFILAGLVIGSIRRPGWFVGYRRRVRERVRTLDSMLAESR